MDFARDVTVGRCEDKYRDIEFVALQVTEESQHQPADRMFSKVLLNHTDPQFAPAARADCRQIGCHIVQREIGVQLHAREQLTQRSIVVPLVNQKKICLNATLNLSRLF